MSDRKLTGRSRVVRRKRYTPAQKKKFLAVAERIGVQRASARTGVTLWSLYRWRRDQALAQAAGAILGQKGVDLGGWSPAPADHTANYWGLSHGPEFCRDLRRLQDARGRTLTDVLGVPMRKKRLTVTITECEALLEAVKRLPPDPELERDIAQFSALVDERKKLTAKRPKMSNSRKSGVGKCSSSPSPRRFDPRSGRNSQLTAPEVGGSPQSSSILFVVDATSRRSVPSHP